MTISEQDILRTLMKSSDRIAATAWVVVREKIAEHIQGLRAKGVRDPAAYEGAMRKMETVEGAMWERRGSK
jgi:hypothetical protein